MFMEIEDLLTGEEVSRLRAIAAAASFVAGRVSNPYNITKNNYQIDFDSPAYKESSSIMLAAFNRSEVFRDFAQPKYIAPPMLCKYGKGMHYGRHSDAAFETILGQRTRFDVSSTVFLSEPDATLGGELTIHLGSTPIRIKGRPGSAIVYPSLTIHEVLPIESGERLVGITFIQSEIRDPLQRDLLYQLGEVYAVEGDQMEWENRIRLQHVQTCLRRMWAD